jgi:ankyrin repeat protein
MRKGWIKDENLFIIALLITKGMLPMKRKLFCLIIILYALSTNTFCQAVEPPTKEDLNRALLHASYSGTVEEVKGLLQKGAEIKAKNEFGSTAFELAVVGNNYNVVELFLDLGQPSNVDYDGVTPLMSAAANGNIELLNLLLKYGAKPDYPTSAGGTALMSATRHTEIFRVLINHGANIHARDNYGRTVLIWAALHGTEEVVALLCTMGADPNIKDKGDNTALSEAQNKGRSNIVRLLNNCVKNR